MDAAFQAEWKAFEAEWRSKETRMMALIEKKFKGAKDSDAPNFCLSDDEQKELESIFQWRFQVLKETFDMVKKEGKI